MKMRIPVSSRLFFCGVFLSLCIFGCASFPGKELPAYTPDQIAAPAQKLSVSFEVKSFALGKENPNSARIWHAEIEKVLTASPLFSQVTSSTGPGEFQYSFVSRNEGNYALAFLSGFISGLTFGIIPGYGKDEYILTVEVKKENKVLKTYEYRDHMESWIQLFLIFLTPSHWPPTVAKDVIDNMIMNFLHDFAADLNSGALLAAGAS